MRTHQHDGTGFGFGLAGSQCKEWGAMHTGDIRVAVEDPPALAARLEGPNFPLARDGPERHLALADVAGAELCGREDGGEQGSA